MFLFVFFKGYLKQLRLHFLIITLLSSSETWFVSKLFETHDITNFNLCLLLLTTYSLAYPIDFLWLINSPSAHLSGTYLLFNVSYVRQPRVRRYGSNLKNRNRFNILVSIRVIFVKLHFTILSIICREHSSL